MLDAPEAPPVAVDAAALPALLPEALRPPHTPRRLGHAAEAAVLLVIVGVSAGLELIGLQPEAYGNTYYAAAVKSMLASWHNFIFVSSDLGGFVSVDKPPLGLWVQVLSARILGFNGVALLLPQALAGIASVGVLYLVVRRVFGGAAGLIAAAALAGMRISVVTARNNTMDTTLVLTLLTGAWLASLAAESGRLKLLLLCAVLVGLAFNIKMLQAYVVVPGFALAYFAFAPLSWGRKLVHLTAAALVLVVVSLSWSVGVDLTPASARPYVGSSGSNSAIALALTYNGLGRVTQAIAPWLAMHHISLPLDLDNMPGMAPGIGDPGLWRLFNPALAGQSSWLLAPAIVGAICAVAAVWLARRKRVDAVRRIIEPAEVADAGSGPPVVALRQRAVAVRRRGVALAVWGGWLLACGAYFSFARFYHTYYLTMLGPAVAALFGIGVIVLWRAYVRGDVLGWALPLLLWGSGVLQVYFTSVSSQWQARLEPWVLATTIGASLILLARPAARPRMLGAVFSIALVGLLIAPTVWSITSVQNGAGAAWLPTAGPGGAAGFGPGGFRGNGGPGFGGGPPGGTFAGGGSVAMTFAGQNWDPLDPRLVNYLESNQGATTYLAATPTSSYASVLTLLSDQPVMALGGYQGWDRIVDPTQLANLGRQGTIRFFLLPGGSGGCRFGGNTLDATADLTAWVQASCTAVPDSAWQGQSSAGLQLYDCAAGIA